MDAAPSALSLHLPAQHDPSDITAHPCAAWQPPHACQPAGRAGRLPKAGLSQTRQEITSVPASLADETSGPSLGSISCILFSPASRRVPCLLQSMVDSRRTDPAQIQLGAPQLQWIQSSTNSERPEPCLPLVPTQQDRGVGLQGWAECLPPASPAYQHLHLVHRASAAKLRQGLYCALCEVA